MSNGGELSVVLLGGIYVAELGHIKDDDRAIPVRAGKH